MSAYPSYQQTASYPSSASIPRSQAPSAGLPTPQASDVPYSCLFKFIIIGDEAVGKTCLLLQFTDKRYRTTHQVTVGVEFGSRVIQIGGQQVKLQCWDTAGQDRFRSIVRSYYRGAAGALLVYDTTRRDSFEHVMQWLQEARQNADPELVVTLVGNKCDKEAERQVRYEEGYVLAQQNGLYFLETSAVTGYHVDEAFRITAERVFQVMQSASQEGGGSSKPVERAIPQRAGYQGQNDYLSSGIGQGGQFSHLKVGQPRGPTVTLGQPRQENDSCC